MSSYGVGPGLSRSIRFSDGGFAGRIAGKYGWTVGHKGRRGQLVHRLGSKGGSDDATLSFSIALHLRHLRLLSNVRQSSREAHYERFAGGRSTPSAELKSPRAVAAQLVRSAAVAHSEMVRFQGTERAQPSAVTETNLDTSPAMAYLALGTKAVYRRGQAPGGEAAYSAPQAAVSRLYPVYSLPITTQSSADLRLYTGRGPFFDIKGLVSPIYFYAGQVVMAARSEKYADLSLFKQGNGKRQASIISWLAATAQELSEPARQPRYGARAQARLVQRSNAANRSGVAAAGAIAVWERLRLWHRVSMITRTLTAMQPATVENQRKSSSSRPEGAARVGFYDQTGWRRAPMAEADEALRSPKAHLPLQEGRFLQASGVRHKHADAPVAYIGPQPLRFRFIHRDVRQFAVLWPITDETLDVYAKRLMRRKAWQPVLQPQRFYTLGPNEGLPAARRPHGMVPWEAPVAKLRHSITTCKAGAVLGHGDHVPIRTRGMALRQSELTVREARVTRYHSDLAVREGRIMRQRSELTLAETCAARLLSGQTLTDARVAPRWSSELPLVEIRATRRPRVQTLTGAQIMAHRQSEPARMEIRATRQPIGIAHGSNAIRIRAMVMHANSELNRRLRHPAAIKGNDAITPFVRQMKLLGFVTSHTGVFPYRADAVSAANMYLTGQTVGRAEQEKDRWLLRMPSRTVRQKTPVPQADDFFQYKHMDYSSARLDSMLPRTQAALKQTVSEINTSDVVRGHLQIRGHELFARRLSVQTALETAMINSRLLGRRNSPLPKLPYNLLQEAGNSRPHDRGVRLVMPVRRLSGDAAPTPIRIEESRLRMGGAPPTVSGSLRLAAGWRQRAAPEWASGTSPFTSPKRSGTLAEVRIAAKPLQGSVGRLAIIHPVEQGSPAAVSGAGTARPGVRGDLSLLQRPVSRRAELSQSRHAEAAAERSARTIQTALAIRPTRRDTVSAPFIARNRRIADAAGVEAGRAGKPISRHPRLHVRLKANLSNAAAHEHQDTLLYRTRAAYQASRNAPVSIGPQSIDTRAHGASQRLGAWREADRSMRWRHSAWGRAERPAASKRALEMMDTARHLTRRSQAKASRPNTSSAYGPSVIRRHFERPPLDARAFVSAEQTARLSRAGMNASPPRPSQWPSASAASVLASGGQLVTDLTPALRTVIGGRSTPGLNRPQPARMDRIGATAGAEPAGSGAWAGIAPQHRVSPAAPAATTSHAVKRRGTSAAGHEDERREPQRHAARMEIAARKASSQPASGPALQMMEHAIQAIERDLKHAKELWSNPPIDTRRLADQMIKEMDQRMRTMRQRRGM
ncbi:hypothetical protein [Paenibacillus solanacearum]|nr:hypothetical protein [Paenibacillus solanacearum]